jgi:probable F420-dependent oxidoreductase
MKIRFAVTPPAEALHESQFDEYLAACETLGFDTIWLSDIPLGPLGDPLVSLAYAAARTTKLKLGMNVVPLGRNPLWLAKQLAQLDRLSGGRLLISLVPGLGQPTERAALGHATGDRGKAIDEAIGLLRTWWQGDGVTADVGAFHYDDVRLSPTPLQDPLEIWLGGLGPQALDRVARLSDGWLTAAATPAEASAGRIIIEKRAAELGRVIDADHFGISMPYAWSEPPAATLAALRQRRPDGDISQILPVGEQSLKSLLLAHIDGGITKFVLRSSLTDDWRTDLTRLANLVLPLQT